MKLDLTRDVAVVVGAAQGIGLAIATEFAGEGAAVALLDRAPCETQARGLRDAHGTPAAAIRVDVRDGPALAAAAEEVAEQLGACRHLVFAAGAGSGKFGYPFWKLSPDDWDAVLQINLVGAVRSLQAFVPQLREAAPGSVLLLASVAAQIGSQTDPPYSAAKAGLLNFMQCAAKDLASHQVRVNAICPGMIRTQLNQAVWQAWNDEQPAGEQKSYDAWADEKIARTTPLGRWQTPEDVAALAVFLASAKAGNITGQTCNVDGGQVMH